MSTRKALTIAGLLFLGILAAGVAFVKTMGTGGGSYVESPDGRMTARATSYSADHLWGGGSRQWIQYSIFYNDGVEHELDTDELFFAR